MNKIIDRNFYPIPENKTSNINHRSVLVGSQGLSNAFFEMGIAFESEEAKQLNLKIFETIQYGCLTSSCELAKKDLPYSTYTGSPISKGLFQHNLWGVKDSELSGMYDWELLRQDIKTHGIRNSLLTGSPPTASTSQLLGNYEL